MTTPATDAMHPGRRAAEFRWGVGAALRSLGLNVETRKGRYRPSSAPSDFQAPELSDVFVTTAVARGERLSVALDEAEALARIAKRKYAFVVHKRRDADPQNAYVSMSLTAWAALMQDRASKRSGRALRATAATPPD